MIEIYGSPPSVFLRGRVYYCRQRIAGRDVWRSLRTGSKRTASRLAFALWLQRQSEPVQVAFRKSFSFSDLWKNYVSSPEFQALSEATKRTKQVNFRAFQEFAQERRISLAKLSPEVLSLFLVSRGKTVKTQKNVKNDLCRVFSASGIPFPDVPLSRLKRPPQEHFPIITDQQHQKILHYLSESRLQDAPEWALAARIAFNTGLRLKDVCLLRFESIGADQRGRYFKLIPAKTSSRTGGRAVLIRFSAELESVIPRSDSGYLLPHLADRYKRFPASISRAFRCAALSAGCDVSFHSYRVLLATKATLAGVDLPSIGGVLGHSSPAVTNIYNRASLDLDMERILSQSVAGL